MLSEINQTILAHQSTKLDTAAIDEALAAAEASRDASLEGRRLAAACALSDRWPMGVCTEIARKLIGGAPEIPLAN
jgi:hypothetical protein